MKDYKIVPGRYPVIALIGKAPSAVKLIPQIPPDRALFGIGADWNISDIIPHSLDAVVEIHPRWWLAHPNYQPGLYAWLHDGHPFPLFTHEKQDDWPNSIEYPLDHLVKKYLSGLVRGPEDAQIRFFTSSLDYLLAIAIEHAPKRIELYGYDMATGTEYAYQREGAAFWLGIAKGLGIEVWLPDNCPMLQSELYGYEGSQRVALSYVDDLLVQEQGRKVEMYNELLRLQGEAPDRDPGAPPSQEHKEFAELYGRVQDMHHIHDGGIQALTQLKDLFQVVDIVNRQELERQLAIANVNRSRHMTNLNFHEGLLLDRYDRMNKNVELQRSRSATVRKMYDGFRAEVQEANENTYRARNMYFVFDGACQVIKHLIGKCDLEPGDYVPFYRMLSMPAPNLQPQDSTVPGEVVYVEVEPERAAE